MSAPVGPAPTSQTFAAPAKVPVTRVPYSVAPQAPIARTVSVAPGAPVAEAEIKDDLELEGWLLLTETEVLVVTSGTSYSESKSEIEALPMNSEMVLAASLTDSVSL